MFRSNLKRWFFPTRLRGWIVLLVAIVLVPMLVAQCVLIYQHFQSVRQIEREELLARAHDGAQLFAAFVEEISRDLGSAGQGLAALAQDDPRPLDRLLANQLAQYPTIHLLAWVDPHGKIVVSSDSDIIGTDVGQRDYFKQAAASPNEHYVMSDLLQESYGGREAFIIARAIHNDSALQGVLIASIAPQSLSQGPLRTIRGKDETLLLFDSRGRLVHREPDVNLTWGQRRIDNWGPQAVRAALAGQEETGIYRSPITGQRRMDAHVPVPELHWVLAVGRPVVDVGGPLWGSIKTVAGLNLLVLAGTVVLLLLGSRRVARDLQALRQHVMALGSDSAPVSPAPVKITELHELGAAFDEMVRRRRLVEETLEEAHKQAVWLARLPDENPSPMLRASSDGTVLYRNPASSRLEGWSCRVGSPVCGPLLALVAQAMGEGHEVQSDQHFGEKSYAVSVMPFPREGYANVYGRDITERLAVEEHLRHAVADLGRSNRDLEQFAYIASHDLQEPLRMITGYLELLEQGYKDKLDEEARTFIGFAVDGARRMQRLVRDLLAYSRLATRGQPLQPAPIQEAYDAAVANLAAVIRDSGAEVMHDDLPVVWADQTQMTVLFQNLLSNALKFHSEERPPRIHVGVQHQDGQWCFAISDNGIGLEPRHADRIFLIFQRLHPRERYPGSGIGLAICKRIVERHGGRIWVESQPGRGATFYFTLPAKEPAGALPPTRIAG